MNRAFEALLVAALGALQTWAFVATTWWWLPLLSLLLLRWRLDQAAPRRAAALGWAYGCAWLLAGVWWLFISMHRYGGLPAPLAAAAVLALSGALALYLALACGLYARWRTGRALHDATLFAALWLLAELARGLLFTGFPWVASGYAWVDAPLAVLAPWVGVYGLGFVMAWLAGLAAGAPRLRSLRARLLAVATVVAVSLVPGAFGPMAFTQSSGSLTVTLLQGNVAQDEKFAAEKMPQALDWAAQQLMAARGELVLGPETVVPLLPHQLEQLAPALWPALQQHFSYPGRAALIGVPLGDFERGYTNSVVALNYGEVYRYDKVHLVPFGEFIPTGFRWFTNLMNIPLGDFSRGVPDAPSFVFHGQHIAPNICYEDLFGEELALRFGDEARAPTVLANVSNIGWFGDTVAVPQHLNISRLRSLEFQRPMLRATNTGATAVIDHHGNVTAQLPPFTRGVLDTRVEGRTGRTPYARWVSAAGLWPLVALALVIAWWLGPAAAGARARRR